MNDATICPAKPNLINTPGGKHDDHDNDTGQANYKVARRNEEILPGESKPKRQVYYRTLN